MAITTIDVTKVGVRLTQLGQYAVTLHLSCLDGTTEVLAGDFTVEHKTGGNVTNEVNAVKAAMQAAIDNYKAEQVIYNSATLDNAVTALKNGLVA